MKAYLAVTALAWWKAGASFHNGRLCVFVFGRVFVLDVRL